MEAFQTQQALEERLARLTPATEAYEATSAAYRRLCAELYAPVQDVAPGELTTMFGR